MSIIVTAQLDETSANRFDALRKQHFPAHLNYLSAHVTLFHSLDEHQAAAIARLSLPPAFPVTFSDIRFLGRGVAISIASPLLLDLRAQLYAAASGQFTRQDEQSFRPHITIQNKVDPDVARALFDDLAHDFTPSTGKCIGVQLWDYLGSPWRLRTTLPLASS